MRPRRCGPSTVLVCAAVLLGQLAGIAYEARAIHRFCSEHGQLEHADEAQPATQDTAPPSDDGPSVEPVIPILAGASSHEHCLFLVTFGDDLGFRPPQHRVPETSQRLRPSPSGKPRVRIVDLLSAPKTSPPSVDAS